MMPGPKGKRKKRGPYLSVGPEAEVLVPVVRAYQSPLGATQWLVTLECGHERWVTSSGQPKKAHCHACQAKSKKGDSKGDSWGWVGGSGGGNRRGPKGPDDGGAT